MEFLSEENATKIFYTPSAVKVHVERPSEYGSPKPEALIIYKLNKERNHTYYSKSGCIPDSISVCGWLQIGKCKLLLIRGFAITETTDGVFIFKQELLNGGVGQEPYKIGIKLLKADVQQLELFRRILEHLTETISDFVSAKIVTGAGLLSSLLVKGASYTRNFIEDGAKNMKQNLPVEKNSLEIDPGLKNGLKVASIATNSACKVTTSVVETLGGLIGVAGNMAAPYVRQGGAAFLADSFNRSPGDAERIMDSVMTVASGVGKGFSTLFMGLETATRTLFQGVSASTAIIVEHRYGEETAGVVKDAFDTVGNVAMITHNMKNFQKRTIATKAAVKLVEPAIYLSNRPKTQNPHTQIMERSSYMLSD